MLAATLAAVCVSDPGPGSHLAPGSPTPFSVQGSPACLFSDPGADASPAAPLVLTVPTVQCRQAGRQGGTVPRALGLPLGISCNFSPSYSFPQGRAAEVPCPLAPPALLPCQEEPAIPTERALGPEERDLGPRACSAPAQGRSWPSGACFPLCASWVSRGRLEGSLKLNEAGFVSSGLVRPSPRRCVGSPGKQLFLCPEASWAGGECRREPRVPCRSPLSPGMTAGATTGGSKRAC